jgi:hypothetical protein
MIQEKTKQIDGHNISVTQFPGRRALALKTKLIRLLGTPIAKLIADVKKIDADMDLSKMAGAVEALVSNLDEKDFVPFVLEMLQCTRIDGKEINDGVFDLEFAANLSLMYKILWFVLEVNFGDFFDKAGIGKILSVKAKPKITIPAK